MQAQAQEYDILLKNGTVIDPKNKLNKMADVAIKDGKDRKGVANIADNTAKRVVDVTGLFVAPGFIDLHTHVFVGSKPETFADGSLSVSPDDFTLKAGVTTVVDAGTSGWRNFATFKNQVIDKSKTRILAFLNIAGNGMTGSPYEQDMNDMDAYMTSITAKRYPDVVVGVKIGHFEGNDWTPFDRAIEAGKLADRPVFVECHLPQFSLEDQLKKMRPGDIITHSFEKVSERMPVTDSTGARSPICFSSKTTRRALRPWSWRCRLLVQRCGSCNEERPSSKYIRHRPSPVQHQCRNERHAQRNV